MRRVSALVDSRRLLVPSVEEEAASMREIVLKTVDTAEQEAGQDEEIDDDDRAEKFKKRVKRAQTSERTDVPTDVKAWFCVFHELQNRECKWSLRHTWHCVRKLNLDMFWKLGRDTPYCWRENVERRRGLHRRLLNEAEVFVVAAVCKGLAQKPGVTSTVLRMVAEQALKRDGAEKNTRSPQCVGSSRWRGCASDKAQRKMLPVQPDNT